MERKAGEVKAEILKGHQDRSAWLSPVLSCSALILSDYCITNMGAKIFSQSLRDPFHGGFRSIAPING